MTSPESIRVSRIGRGTLGTYWPKPIERRLGLKPGTRMEMQFLGPTTALLRVQRAPAKARSKRAAAPRRRL